MTDVQSTMPMQGGTRGDAQVSVGTDRLNPPADEGDAYERTRALLEANRGTELALLATLRACNVKPEDARPYREVEKELEAVPSVAESTQMSHTLIEMLVRSGGVAAVPVPERRDAEDDPEGFTPADKPTGHLVHITDAGRAVLADFDPQRRFEELLSQEPAGYADAYARVLAACEGTRPDGAGLSRAEVESVLSGDPALTNPRRVYPSYFISKLESIEGLIWDGGWHTTDAGERMLDALAMSS
jgi:hypothetical protein